MKKPKLEIFSSKSTGVKPSLSASSKGTSPFMPKRSYKKKQADVPKTEISFGQTGLTGES
jgi:hypothetical protein